jgi:hypothetical protein
VAKREKYFHGNSANFHYPGAGWSQRTLDLSFYASINNSHAEPFVARALAYFGIPEPSVHRQIMAKRIKP